MTQLALPLVSAVLAFLGGLLAGLRSECVTGGIALAAVPLLLAPWAYRRLIGQQIRHDWRAAALLAAMLIAGAGHGAGARDRAEGDCRALLSDGAEVTVRGALAANWNPPSDPRARRPLLPVDAAGVERAGTMVRNCAGGMRVRLPRGSDSALAGTELVLRGRWTRLPRPVLGSGWPRDPGFTGYVQVDSVEVRAPPRYAAHPLLKTRGRTERQLHRLMGRHGPLADALLLGRRETLDRELSDRFAKTGLVHLLAISGTHVALMGAVFVLIGRMLRLPRNRVAWLTILLIALYLAVIGAPPSALRSGIMLALALLAVVLQRPSATLPIVAAAALVILAVQPMAALDIGFQLSFAGVLGIILLHGAMMRRLPRRMKKEPARWLAESVSLSVAAFVTTAPIVAHHFGQVAPVSIIANLPAIPLTSLALIGIGAAAVAEPVLPPLAHLLADGAGVALDLLNGVVDLALQVPGGHAPVARPQWWAWAATAAVFLLALDAAGRMRDRVRWAVAAMSAAGAFLLLPLVGAAAGSGGVEIAFIDVGQGDAVALRTTAGRWILVDAGERDDGWDAGERRVLPYLRARGAKRIEAMILTHPHADHVGGAAAVMRAMPVGRVIDPGMPMGTPVYLQTLRVAEERGIDWNTARQDRTLQVDGVELTFLWPAADFLDAPADANDISAVVLVRYGDFAALLTGDAPAEVEHRLIARYGDSLRADVLKAGHHGSRTASSGAFLDVVNPELVVVSAGLRNDYGHPHAEVLARLGVRRIEIARTDRDGTVRIEVEPGGTAWHRVEP